MATLHLMVGLPCSGKTTLARRLEQEQSALRLTPDEWQIGLFGQDANEPEHDARHSFIEAMLWNVASRALELGTNVILDYGFWAREEREDYRLRAKRLGATVDDTFRYDGNGALISTTDSAGQVTILIGDYFEWTGSAATATSFYYASGLRVAMRVGASQDTSGLGWVLTDHLGSVREIRNAADLSDVTTRAYYTSGVTQSETIGTLDSPLRFTGQRLILDLGLYFYQSRWYDPVSSRWLQADTMIPDPYNPLDWDRYAYVRSNPVNATDPTGHVLESGDKYGSSNPEEWEAPVYVYYQLLYSKLVIPKVFKPKYKESNGSFDRTQTYGALEPIELITRAIMSEENGKLNTYKWKDALGVGWEVRNIYETLYAPGKRYNKITTDAGIGLWYKAATSNFAGMQSASHATFVGDPLGNYSYYGTSEMDALIAYNIAHKIATDVYYGDLSKDPSHGAVDHTDAYKENEVEVPYNRTHFYDDMNRSHSPYCVDGVNPCN